MTYIPKRFIWSALVAFVILLTVGPLYAQGIIRRKNVEAALSDPDIRVGLATLEILQRLRKEGVDVPSEIQLPTDTRRRLLNTSDTDQLMKVLIALHGLPSLCTALQAELQPLTKPGLDPSSPSRIAAVIALISTDEPTAATIEQLLLYLENKDENQQVIIEIEQAIGHFVLQSTPEIRDRFIRLLHNRELSERAIHAIEAQAELGASFSMEVWAALKRTKPNDQLQTSLLQALTHIGPPASMQLPDLEPWLSAESENVRRMAIEVARHLQSAPPTVIAERLNKFLILDEKPIVVVSTLKALRSFGEVSSPYAQKISSLLLNSIETHTNSPEVLAEGLHLLRVLRVSHLIRSEHLLELMRHPIEATRDQAVLYVAEFDPIPTEAVQLIIEIVADEKVTMPPRPGRFFDAISRSTLDIEIGPYFYKIATESEQAITKRLAEAIADAPELRNKLKPELLSLLNDGRQSARSTALTIIRGGVRFNDTQLLEIANNVTHPSRVCRESIQVLAIHSTTALPVSTPLAVREFAMKTTDPIDFSEAVKALEAFGSFKSDTEILAKLWPENPEARKAILHIASSDIEFAIKFPEHRIIDGLSHSQTAGPTMKVIRLLNESGHQYTEEVARYLVPKRQGVWLTEIDVSKTLLAINPLTRSGTLDVLSLSHQDSNYRHRHRAHAYLFAQGSDLDAVRRLGLPIEPINTEKPRDLIAYTLQLWPSLERHAELQKEAAELLENTVQGHYWTNSDLELLSNTKETLASRYPNASNSISMSIWSARARLYATRVLSILVVHVIVWLVLLAFYPHSPPLQALVFWNPVVRRWAGLFYVDLLLIYLPTFRKRMFLPFRESLVEEIIATNFDQHNLPIDQFYYQSTQVRRVVTDDHDKLETIELKDSGITTRGRIIIEGVSGIGKTTFLRRLIERSRNRIVVYLPAERCASGVLAEIEARVHGLNHDLRFVRSLVYAGAVDICIDGVNEVSPDVRAEIRSFARQFPYANILIATQPLEDWRLPSFVMCELMPLDDRRVEEFLLGRAEAARADLECHRKVCRRFLAESKDNAAPPSLRKAMRLTLSNPMDLTTISDMLLSGCHPDLLRLQEQQYAALSRRYRSTHQREFPLRRFSEVVYQMRLRDESAFPDPHQFPEELESLHVSKMMLLRKYDMDGDITTKWYFRHDKIMEFFVLRAFLDESEDRPVKHLADPRFRGVYSLLAMTLPHKLAQDLASRLNDAAVKVGDHGVSDRFIELVSSRPNMGRSIPGWSSKYVLPLHITARREFKNQLDVQKRNTEEIRQSEAAIQLQERYVAMLSESNEDILFEIASDALIDIGARGFAVGEDEFRDPHFVDPCQRSYLMKTVIVDDGEDMESAIYDKIGVADDIAERILLVANVNPSVDPSARIPIDPALRNAALERNTLIISTVELFNQIAASQSGITREKIWQSLIEDSIVGG